MTLPNWLTLMRLLLVPFVVWAIAAEAHQVALALFLLAAATDAVDGLLARLLDLESPLGRILDPCADKALVAASMIMLTLGGLLPVWLTALVVARDVAIVAVVAVFALSGAKWRVLSIQPSAAGKANTFAQSGLIAVVLAGAAFGISANAFESGLIAVVAGLTLISGYGYLAGWLHVITNGREPAR
jgi:cardiolipin synthase